MSKKSNKIEIDILSDISDIQEGHSQVIPIVTENEDELSENYSIPESLPILSLRRLGAVPRLDYPHYGGPGEVHEGDTRRGGRHGNTRCGTSEGVRRRAARTGRHVPHRHGSPHSQDARHAQRQPDRHPARPRKNRDKRIPLFGALLHGDGHAAQGYDARLRQRGVRGARGIHQGRGAEHHQRFAQHTEGSIVRHQEHRQQTRHHQLHLFQPRLRGCRPPAAARSAGTAGACPPPAGNTRTRTAGSWS